MRLFFSFLFFIALSTGTWAQIPNAGFENWSTIGNGNVPNGWETLNTLTDSTGIYTCNPGGPGMPGNHYLALISKQISSFGVVPGLATCGTLDFNSFKPKSGFPFTQRPKALTGNWQYMAELNSIDQGFISIVLTRWNTASATRDTISYTTHNLVGMQMAWAPFYISLDYQRPDFPDTAIIFLSASKLRNAAPTSFLFIDALSFTDASDAVYNVSNEGKGVQVYPNPAKNTFTIGNVVSGSGSPEVYLFDISGRFITNIHPGNSNFSKNTYDISGVAPGIYLLKIFQNSNSVVRKIVIQ